MISNSCVWLSLCGVSFAYLLVVYCGEVLAQHLTMRFHCIFALCESHSQCSICYMTSVCLISYIWQHGRVVKAIDSKSIGLCPRGFKSHCCRIYIYVCMQFNAWMAERSKAVDLSSIIFGCVGSNPTSGKQLTCTHSLTYNLNPYTKLDLSLS